MSHPLDFRNADKLSEKLKSSFKDFEDLCEVVLKGNVSSDVAYLQLAPVSTRNAGASFFSLPSFQAKLTGFLGVRLR